MKLIDVLGLVLGGFGVGTALFVCLQQTGEIRKSFFVFQSYLVGVCCLLMSFSIGGGHFLRATFFSSAVLAGLAAWNFSRERPVRGKGWLASAAALTAFFMAAQVCAASPVAAVRMIRLVNLAAGIFLSGWVNGAMILGHWYLIMRGLSFSHFQRATQQLLVAVGFRTMVLAGLVVWGLFPGEVGRTMIQLPGNDPLFFSMRLIWGLVLPGIFGFMAWRCARTGANQAGTGLLYIAEVAVLIGEILAGGLGI